MVNYSQAPLDATFGALADPTRRAILARLALGEAMVTELAEPFAMSLPAISKHLRVLESAGLLERQIDGRVHRCRLAAEPLKDASAWIAQYRAFWETQLDALATYLEKATTQEDSSCQPHSARRNTRSRSSAPLQRRGKKSSPRGPNASN
jgi:DNA-binding transcriptional ArsR family regulator